MPRKAPKIEIRQEDKATLMARASRRALPKQTVYRAKMILDREQGKPLKQIAKELNSYPNKAIYWRKRYVEKGLEGLNDNPRSGRPVIYDNTLLDRV